MTELHPRTLVVYQQPDGTHPYSVWLDTVEDARARAAITTRLNRVALGLWGDHRSVGNGVWELRIHYGPGFRVYYGE